jgi:hypothetical protein
MILRPKKYIEEDGVYVYFLEDEGKDRLHKLCDAYICENGNENKAQDAFLRCFKWEPMDGQHVRAAHQEIAYEDLKIGIIIAKEYEALFSRWPIQVVILDS